MLGVAAAALLLAAGGADRGSAVGTPTCFGEPATLVGTPGADVVEGTGGRDVIVTGKGFDEVHGRGGNDRICTGRGGDQLYGEGGRDRLAAGPDGKRVDDDVITSDLLVGGPGDDLLNGGPGLRDDSPGRGDTVVYRGSPRAVHLDLDSGVAAVGPSHDRLVSIEDAVGSAQADILTGDERENDLTGGRGADMLRGMGRFDRLIGGAGADDAFGGPDAAYDIILGGSGADRLLGGPGDDEVYGDADADRLAGGRGDDRLYGDAGQDTADGGPDRRFDVCRAEMVTGCER